MPDDIKRISLRIPASLHAKIETAASTNRRSLHAEILTAIDRYTEEEIPMAKMTAETIRDAARTMLDETEQFGNLDLPGIELETAKQRLAMIANGHLQMPPSYDGDDAEEIVVHLLEAPIW